jgi:hypothetical protein
MPNDNNLIWILRLVMAILRALLSVLDSNPIVNGQTKEKGS